MIVLMNTEAVLREQFSARAHSSTKQQVGCAKYAWYDVSLFQGIKPTRFIFLWQELPAAAFLPYLHFLQLGTGKIKDTEYKQVGVLVWVVRP